MGKKVNGNCDIINKNGYSTFHTGKPENFKSLREAVWIILWHCYPEIHWRWESVAKKVQCLLTSFRRYVMHIRCIMHTLEAPGLYQETLL